MPEPRYSFVRARKTSDRNREGNAGWCWSIRDNRTGHLARLFWVGSTDDILIPVVKEKVENLNAGVLHYHSVTWDSREERHEQYDWEPINA